MVLLGDLKLLSYVGMVGSGTSRKMKSHQHDLATLDR